MVWAYLLFAFAAAALIAVVVAGQSLSSVVVDHFGWVGFGRNT